MQNNSSKIFLILFATLINSMAWGVSNIKVSCPLEISFAPFKVTGDWSASTNPVTLKGTLDLSGVKTASTPVSITPKVSSIHCTYSVPSMRISRNLCCEEVGYINTAVKPWVLQVTKKGINVREEKLPDPYPLALNPITMKLGSTTSTANADVNNAMKNANLTMKYSLIRGGTYGNGGKPNPTIDYNTPGSATNPNSLVTVLFNTTLACSGDGTKGLTCVVP